MHRPCFLVSFTAALLVVSSAVFAAPRLAGIGEAMDYMIGQNEIAGAVTVVLAPDRTLHLQAHGYADIATKRPMTPDSLFWIASMTKPVTGVAVMMLQDEGRLNVDDPVAKYIPEFAKLKTPSGRPANLTIMQILSHTSGLGEAPREATARARTLADLVPVWLSQPMQYEPGAKWKYTQSGINLAGRIVEIVSGLSFDAFLQKRVFDPLGMKDTTFYPTDAQKKRMVTAYRRNSETCELEVAAPRTDFGRPELPPQGNGGLYSTPADYARFLQMLLNRGTLEGKRYLRDATFAELTAVHTGDLPTGFFQVDRFGGHGANYGWALGVCVLRRPHEGVASMLSPGSFGHGGAWGTQAWIDPVKRLAYLLMVQRSNFPNSDASEVRRVFQQCAVDALAEPKS